MSGQVDVLAVLDRQLRDRAERANRYRKDAEKSARKRGEPQITADRMAAYTDLQLVELSQARAAVAALIAERDALREALSEAEWRLSCIGTPRDAQGRYHKDGEWTFGDALPNSADAREVASAFALIRAALTTGESA